MKSFNRTLTAIALTTALGLSASQAQALGFDTKSRVTGPVTLMPSDILDKGTVNPGSSRTGYIQFLGDKDSYRVPVAEEGILYLRVGQTAAPVLGKLYDASGRYVTSFSSSALNDIAVKVKAGNYRVDLQSNSRRTATTRYQLTTGFSAKPTEKALLVLLENGGISVDVQETITQVDMLQMLEDAAARFGLSIDQVEDMIRDATDGALEGGTAATIRALNNVHKKYDHIVILEDGDFNQDTVVTTLDALSTDFVVDIHVLAHGSKSAFIGQEAFGQSFFEQLPGIPELYLRSVYQMNCYGSHLIDEWRTYGGVEAVNGSQDINWMPPSYFVFLDEWMQGAGFEDAVQTGYNRMVPVARAVYEIVDQYDEASDTQRTLVDPLVFANPNVVPGDELQASVQRVQGTRVNVTVD